MAPAGAGRARQLGVEVDVHGARDVALPVGVAPGRPAELPAGVEQGDAVERTGELARFDQRATAGRWHTGGSTGRSATRPAPGRRCRPLRRVSAGASRACTARPTPSSVSGRAGSIRPHRFGAPPPRACCRCSPDPASRGESRPRSGGRDHLLERVLAGNVADVDDHRPPGSQVRAHEGEELPRDEIERDVGLAVGVEEDVVVARPAGRQPRPGVGRVEVKPRTAEVEVPPARSWSARRRARPRRRGVREEVAVVPRHRSGRVAEDRDPAAAGAAAGRGSRPSSRRSEYVHGR